MINTDSETWVSYKAPWNEPNVQERKTTVLDSQGQVDVERQVERLKALANQVNALVTDYHVKTSESVAHKGNRLKGQCLQVMERALKQASGKIEETILKKYSITELEGRIQSLAKENETLRQQLKDSTDDIEKLRAELTERKTKKENEVFEQKQLLEEVGKLRIKCRGLEREIASWGQKVMSQPGNGNAAQTSDDKPDITDGWEKFCETLQPQRSAFSSGKSRPSTASSTTDTKRLVEAELRKHRQKLESELQEQRKQVNNQIAVLQDLTVTIRQCFHSVAEEADNDKTPFDERVATLERIVQSKDIIISLINSFGRRVEHVPSANRNTVAAPKSRPTTAPVSRYTRTSVGSSRPSTASKFREMETQDLITTRQAASRILSKYGRPTYCKTPSAYEEWKKKHVGSDLDLILVNK